MPLNVFAGINSGELEGVGEEGQVGDLLFFETFPLFVQVFQLFFVLCFFVDEFLAFDGVGVHVLVRQKFVDGQVFLL